MYLECSVTCGGGTQRRERDCSVEGQCTHIGPGAESRPCNMEECPAKAVWAEWEELSPCSQSCGGGFQTTRRSCVNGTIGVAEDCPISEYMKIAPCGQVTFQDLPSGSILITC